VTLRRTLLAIGLAVLTTAVAVAPVVLQQPFGAQTPSGMAVAHATRQWGPLLTAALAAAVIWLAWSAARGARWWGRVLLVAPVAVVLAAAWFARQNAFEWWFNRLSQPRFVAAGNSAFVEANDLVLAVTRDGDAAAYPIRLIAYHHIVNDRIGRTPAVVTY
jgi:Protein of unknown function (DUF3179)